MRCKGRSTLSRQEQWIVGPHFPPWADLTLQWLKQLPGDRLLDIACGAGIVAGVSKERIRSAGHVAGVDLCPEMFAVARAVALASTGAKAMSAPFLFAIESLVDVVVCQQDKPVAAAEMRRAVVKGGRSAVATSRSDDEIPLM